jgi:hypothetical protein
MKALGWIIGLIALLIVAIGVYVVMNSGALLERAIETYGSRYLGARVDVGEVTVSLTDGSAAINRLVIDNPEGFSGPPAFQLSDISMTLNTDQLSSELIVLEEVIIEGASVAALVRGRETNLQRLMDNLNAQTASAEAAEETGVESEVKLIIDRFDFTAASASVDSDLLGQATVDIPDIHLADIGRQSNGATVGQVLQQVLEPVVRAVSRKLIEQGVDLEGARDRLEGNLRERADEALGGRLDRLRGAVRPDGSDESRDQQ